MFDPSCEMLTPLKYMFGYNAGCPPVAKCVAAYVDGVSVRPQYFRVMVSQPLSETDKRRPFSARTGSVDPGQNVSLEEIGMVKRSQDGLRR